METQTSSGKALGRNRVWLAVLNIAWWFLKASFKVLLAVISAVVAITIFLFNNDEENKKETEFVSSIHARRGIGLSNSDRTKLDNSIHSGDDY